MAMRSEWVVERAEATGTGGMVAAKTPLAAEAGAAVLAKGGNAVDAAVTTAFVAAVVEPWMNGIGGGGYMVIHGPGIPEAEVIAYPMVAPAGATADMFPLGGSSLGFFGWPSVVDSANVAGPRSAGVPGTVAGLALALERHGTISLAEAIAPATELAERGFPAWWHTTLKVAQGLGAILAEPETARIFTRDGIPPVTLDDTNPALIRQSDLAATLRTIADQGPRAFYEGEIASKIAGHLAQRGTPFAADDLARYEPSVEAATAIRSGLSTVYTTAGGTGGTTLAEAMSLLDRAGIAETKPGSADRLHLIAECLKIAFADRFAYLADPTHVDVPLERLLSDAYLTSRAGGIDRERASRARAGMRDELGVTHDLATSVPDYTSGGSTTHLSVVDRAGLAVTCTQTLLSLWGSVVTVPGTGVLMNNGMMWFDPEPGRPNSVAGGKRPLSNMAPSVVVGDDGSAAALGASGGRRIMSAVLQVALNLVGGGRSMQAAVGAPRIDASTPKLFISPRFGPDVAARLTGMGHPFLVKDERVLLGDYASPACVRRDASGSYTGGVDPYYYPATAVGVD